MMEPAPSALFEMAEPDLLPEFLIIGSTRHRSFAASTTSLK